jgi:serine/threonine protein kinase
MNAFPPTHPTDQTLHAYGVGTLEDDLASRVDSHLEDCPDCRRRVAELSGDSFVQRLRAGAASTPEGAAPPVAAPPRRSPKKPAHDALPPELADQYELVRELGRGGMGVVWLARNKLLDRLEALKILNKDMLARRGTLDRFLREIRAVARLNHENVVRAYSALQLGDALVFVLEYVEGMDLARLVRQRGPLPVQHACYFTHQAALGLQHAHERGMVHRDIKPGNLILQKQGQRAVVKVLDFGLAKALSERSVDGGLTHEGQMLGTPDYIAPEQTLDAQRADIRADIYSLGCTLYYLLAGDPPFSGTSLYEVLQAHHATDAKPLNLVRPEVPAELAAVVARAMAKDPARRFQTPKEFAQALTPFFKSAPPAAKPGPPPAEQPRASGTPPEAGAGAAQPRWATLVEFKETERSAAAPASPEPTPAAPAPAPPRRPPWRTPALAAGLLLLGVFLAGAVVLRLRTPYGELVFTDLPRDAVVTSDGARVTVEWTGNDGHAKVPLTVGQHKIGVVINGVEVRGKELTIVKGVQTPFTIALEPAVPAAPAKQQTETRVVSLFNGRDLSGWKSLLDNGSQWEVVDGDLEGRGGGELRPAVLVLADRALTNFKLRFQARYVRPGGGWVELRRTASGESGLNTNCYAFAHGAWPAGKPRAGSGGAARSYEYGTPAQGAVPGTAAPLSTNRWHQYEFVVENNRITTSVDGAVSSELIDEDELYPSGSIALAVNGLDEAQFRDIALEEIPDDELTSPRSKIQGRFAALFNGKDFSGWSSMLDNGSTWSVADGVLEGHGGGATGKPGVLVYEGQRFANFRLRFQVCYPENGFGWVELRRGGKTDDDGFYAVAHAVHPRPAPAAGAYMPVGSVNRARHSRYQAKPVWDYEPDRTPLAPGEWHRFDIKVVGNRITTSVDGNVVSDYTDPEALHTSGLIALACGAVDSVVQYKDVLIETLPDDAVASEPKPATAAAPAPDVRKEMPATASPGFALLFNGTDLNGWKVERGGPGGWRVEDGHLAATGSGGPKNQSFLLSEQSYGDFVLRLEFCLPAGSDSGIVFWADRVAARRAPGAPAPVGPRRVPGAHRHRPVPEHRDPNAVARVARGHGGSRGLNAPRSPLR